MTASTVSSPNRVGITQAERERLLQSFCTALEAEGLSPATIRLYLHGVLRLCSCLDLLGLADLPMGNVSAEHLREVLNMERQRGVSPATLEAMHKAIRRFFAFLVEEGEATENIAMRLPKPKVPEMVVPALRQAEIEALFRAIRRDRSTLGLRDEAICAALLDTGLRASELLSLTVEGLDHRERRALVLGKGARERLASFEAKTLRLIDRYHRRTGVTSGALFRDRSAKPLSPAGLYLMVRRRGEEADIARGLWPHRFRHTCASALLREGVAENAVRTLLGWSRNSSMLARYVASAAAEQALEERERVRLVG